MGFLDAVSPLRALQSWQTWQVLRAFGDGDYNEWRVVLMAPFGWPVRIFALLAAAVIFGLAFRALRGDVRRRRAALLALRSLGLLAVLVILFQPALKLRNVTRMPNHIAVVADVSQSMQLAEDGGSETRASRIATVLRKARDSGELRRWRDDHILDFFGFGERVSPLAESDLVRAAGPSSTAPATRIREALASVRQRYDGRDLAGIVLLSDGLDNGRLAATEPVLPSKTAARPGDVNASRPVEAGAADHQLDADTQSFLKTLDVPVHTIFVGKPGLRDVAITRVLADQFAFVRTAVEVEAHIMVLGAQAAGWEGRHLPVTLRRDGQHVLTVEVAILPGQREYRVVFPFTPERVGKYLYEISIPTLPGEAIAENNHRAFVLRVVRDKIRVVHVAGRPTWDVRFLRGLLKHDPNIDLVSFFILRSPSDIEFVPSEETSLIPFPCEELFQEQLRSFDLVILHNFNYSAYCGQFLQPAIVPFVNEGGAIAMLGGDLSFSSGGYYGSELSQILPVVLLPDDGSAASPAASASSNLIDSDAFQPRLTPAGRSHVVTALRLDVRENAAIWDSLPSLEGLNLVARARPQATVLLSHPKLRDDSGNPMPVLTVAEFGKGRTLALQADSTWRWGFGTASRAESGSPRSARRAAAGDSALFSGDESGRSGAYQRFFTQAIRWLVRDPSLRLLRIETNDSEYSRGQRVRAEVRAYGPDYRPAQRADINISLSRITEEGSDTGSASPAPQAGSLARSLRTDEEGQASVEWDSLPPGGYRIVARAVLGGRPAEDSEVFLIRGSSRELDNPEADDRLLRLVSAASSGESRRFSDGGNSGPLKSLPFHPPHVVRVNQQRDIELWHHPVVLLLAISAFALNWLLRRRWGYA